MLPITIKRIYEEASEKDGYRVVFDRLWTRGISKEGAQLDEWNKEIAPSTELRKWFDHQEERFPEFTKRYEDELKEKIDDIQRLRGIAEKQPVTLLYSAKNIHFNQAVVLCNFLKRQLPNQLTYQRYVLQNQLLNQLVFIFLFLHPKKIRKHHSTFLINSSKFLDYN